MSHATQTVSQLTAPTLTVEAGTGVTYAYRRFGRRDDRWPPLLFLQHFRGNLDNWDPVLVDTIAAHREVILLDNTGVGLSSGTVPVTVTEMARDAIAFVDALEIDRIDLLGYSLGGMVAQEFALLRPRVVRRIVLAGTGPRGGRQMHGWIVDIERTANQANNGLEDLLHIFFEITETSRALGREYIQRAFSRTEGRDKPNGPAVARAQYDAIVEWGIPDPSRFNRLAGITQPTRNSSRSSCPRHEGVTAPSPGTGQGVPRVRAVAPRRDRGSTAHGGPNAGPASASARTLQSGLDAMAQVAHG
jgi:pimeloyl-ACP methyl ester carboxylesterase